MKIGSLVECIVDLSSPLELPGLIRVTGKDPIKGQIYTISGFVARWPGLQLEEIPWEGIHQGPLDGFGWPIKFFREIQPPMQISLSDFNYKPLKIIKK